MIADFDRALSEDGAFAYRRLHWEAGLIGQALYLWASAVGFAGTGIGCFFDDEVHALLGLAAGAIRNSRTSITSPSGRLSRTRAF